MPEDESNPKTASQEKLRALSAQEMRAILKQSVADADEMDRRLKRVFQLAPANASLRLK